MPVRERPVDAGQLRETLQAGPSPRRGFAQRNANADLPAVGAVYDRAVFAIEWEKRAVIDRAYSGKWAANFQRERVAIHVKPV